MVHSAHINIVWGTIAWLLSIGLLGLVFGTVIWGTKPGQTGEPPERIVPNLSGKTRTQAVTALTAADLNGNFIGTGHATSQEPFAGATAHYGDYVDVFLA